MVRGPEHLAELRALYLAKAKAEQDDADALLPTLRVLSGGDPLARVLLVKGVPGLADVAAGEALAGADGDAARAALQALGVGTSSVLAVVTRAAAGARGDPAVERLGRYLESADPGIAIALDEVAAAALAAAAGLGSLVFGEAVRVHGRLLLAVDGLEASLADEARKKRVWKQLGALRRESATR